MKIKCTKYEWALLESALVQAYHDVETEYKNPTFLSRFPSKATDDFIEIHGEFEDGH